MHQMQEKRHIVSLPSHTEDWEKSLLSKWPQGRYDTTTDPQPHDHARATGNTVDSREGIEAGAVEG